MSRNSTIEILNDAYDFMRKLEWQLFVIENEAIVYGDGSGWQPGDPLHKKPRGHLFGEQTRRLMFDLFEDDLGFHTPTLWPDDIWCYDCEVGWDEANERCWVCSAAGEDLMSETPSQNVIETISAESMRRIMGFTEPAARAARRAGESVRMLEPHFRSMSEGFSMHISRDDVVTNDEFSQVSIYNYVRATTQMHEDMWRVLNRRHSYRNWAVDFETFEPRAVEYAEQDCLATALVYGLEWQPRGDERNRSRRDVFSRPRFNGLRAHFRITDEWQPPTEYNYTSHGVFITIPYEIPTQRDIPLPNRGSLAESIAARHRERNPQYYNDSPIYARSATIERI